MRLLVELGADPSLTNADHATPLMAAAGLGTLAPGEEAGTEDEALEAVEFALELGGDVNAVDDNGETAMHGAAYKSLPKMVQWLADHGAGRGRVEPQEQARLDAAVDRRGLSAGQLQAVAGHDRGDPAADDESGLGRGQAAEGVRPVREAVRRCVQVAGRKRRWVRGDLRLGFSQSGGETLRGFAPDFHESRFCVQNSCLPPCADGRRHRPGGPGSSRLRREGHGARGRE